ncbi:hypothetical protein L1987_72209 [Smallanthus sonchifolius]|uniref:Uncharacterized protein n=1 Tax=Smallanthus sonchifolius TaxID=185202 RepID=A0ACB9AVA0_9ASTR|nr:hypothetical protein L1987_72209 [Smallanthus sonchifolius]
MQLCILLLEQWSSKNNKIEGREYVSIIDEFIEDTVKFQEYIFHLATSGCINQYHDSHEDRLYTGYRSAVESTSQEDALGFKFIWR